ncbi:hypothetical protein CYMTET_19233 [Cymbomonas tetramitiformis]|uniref:Uncharacterized protein n=1 Tax=Cymbomonas tetramitiformis TaxID=36881 RepID=A0AAE0G704_9CHLO|nr:hypothetical protein CYMTET_19233 [Cymbomonas tetramitiformis]
MGALVGIDVGDCVVGDLDGAAVGDCEVGDTVGLVCTGALVASTCGTALSDAQCPQGELQLQLCTAYSAGQVATSSPVQYFGNAPSQDHGPVTPLSALTAPAYADEQLTFARTCPEVPVCAVQTALLGSTTVPSPSVSLCVVPKYEPPELPQNDTSTSHWNATL